MARQFGLEDQSLILEAANATRTALVAYGFCQFLYATSPLKLTTKQSASLATKDQQFLTWMQRSNYNVSFPSVLSLIDNLTNQESNS